MALVNIHVKYRRKCLQFIVVVMAVSLVCTSVISTLTNQYMLAHDNRREQGLEDCSRAVPAPGADTGAAAAIFRMLADKYETVDTSERLSEMKSRYELRNSQGKAKQRFPDAMIIGAKKAGTATLGSFMRLSPYFSIHNIEVDFFNWHYEMGFDWYLDMQNPSVPGQIAVERSPNYFTDPSTPQRVLQLNSGMRFVVLLREPAERLVSDFHHELNAGRVPGNISFEELVADQATGDLRTDLDIVQTSVYSKHLSRWLSYFPRTQFLFLDSAELVHDPYITLLKVEQFFRVPNRIKPKNFVFVESKGFYCKRQYNGELTSIKCMGENKGIKNKTKVDPELLRHIKTYFKPHNRALFKLIGQQFSWK